MAITNNPTRTPEVVAPFGEEAHDRNELQCRIPDEIDKILDRFAKLRIKDSRIMNDLVNYDELGLPT